jgi:alanyl-tRNA synthetase
MVKTSNDIRNDFLEYFKSKKHSIVKSSSLVPADDPTLIFVNAGMVQFKDVFLGKEEKEYTRATTSQKCMRVSGKHNDLENVGRTARHHTFFEMLGNFSFGDYFKEDAIKFGWDFLTDKMGIDPKKLWITVYNDDDDAYNIWKDKLNIKEDRIIRLGEKDNFWSMGETGPCGPCSEIHIDQGEHMSCGESCGLGVCDCDRWLEIWNLVFMQYDRDETGKLTPLPKPSIDTGMGLERLTAIIQGKESNYDTDLFSPTLEYISKLVDKKYISGDQSDDAVAMRVIADHARSTVFLMADGVIPSNEARGYVLRRVMRRAIRFGKKLGFENNFFDKICLKVVEQMGSIYPELEQNKETIEKIVINEETRFRKTLDKGEKILNTEIENLSKNGIKIIDGATLFLLYDAYGFPIDLSELIALENGFTIDENGFKKALLEQKSRSRAKQKFINNDKEFNEILDSLYKKHGKTEFSGYECLVMEGTLLSIIDENNNEIDEALADDEAVFTFVFDKTPFYAESGGQASDTGFLEGENYKAELLDVQKTAQGVFYHRVKVNQGLLKINKKYNLIVDKEKRDDTAKNHSATHLLQAGIRAIIGDHVHQEGSFVDSEKLRFDFNHFEALTDEEIRKIEVYVNDLIMSDAKSIIQEMNIDDAKKSGAMALFNEKYGDIVRTIKLTDNSFELCGGTHVRRTGEIGPFKIISESSVASGIRRIEAIRGVKVIKLIQKQYANEKRIVTILKSSKDSFIEKLDSLVKKNKDLEKEINNLKKEINILKLSSTKSDNNDNSLNINGHSIIFNVLANLNANELKGIGDNLKQKHEDSLIFLLSKSKENYMIVLMKGAKCSLHCGNILKSLMSEINGRGGGKDNMAQGGATLDFTVEQIKEKLTKIMENQK